MWVKFEWVTDGLRKTDLFNVICTQKQTKQINRNCDASRLLADFLSNTICSSGPVWQEIIWNNELDKYIKTDTLHISIKNIEPAKKF